VTDDEDPIGRAVFATLVNGGEDSATDAGATLRDRTPELNQEDEMNDETVATVEESLRLGSGFGQNERPEIVEGWASLDARLRSFSAGTVEMELSVKERGTASQRTVLEAWISGQNRVVATSSEPDLDQALHEVRDDLIRQLTDAKNRTEPRNNPSLRTTERHER
jgi:ribosome-associated translation inhibitor RaiA